MKNHTLLLLLVFINNLISMNPTDELHKLICQDGIIELSFQQYSTLKPLGDFINDPVALRNFKVEDVWLTIGIIHRAQENNLREINWNNIPTPQLIQIKKLIEMIRNIM